MEFVEINEYGNIYSVEDIFADVSLEEAGLYGRCKLSIFGAFFWEYDDLNSFSLKKALIYLIEKGYSFEVLKKEFIEIQEKKKSEIESVLGELEEFQKEEVIKLYIEYKKYLNRRKFISSMTKARFFADKGFDYAKKYPRDFYKVYKNKFLAYDEIEAKVIICKWFLEENRIDEIKKEYDVVEDILKKERTKIDENGKKKKIISEEGEKLNLFLKTFRDYQQKFISFDNVEEINLYLAFGYEVLESSLLSKRNLLSVFLKPSGDYIYTEEFEKVLIKFYFKNKIQDVHNSQFMEEILDFCSNLSNKKNYFFKKNNYKGKVVEFYNSRDWLSLRHDVLKEQNGKCQLCGRTRKDGVILHVDHIVPLSVDWSKRLDKDNLQVLCEECNMGKSNRDDTDWR